MRKNIEEIIIILSNIQVKLRAQFNNPTIHILLEINDSTGIFGLDVSIMSYAWKRQITVELEELEELEMKILQTLINRINE